MRLDEEITIRNAEERIAFTYTVRRAGCAIRSEEIDAEEYVAPGYYGGSEAMD